MRWNIYIPRARSGRTSDPCSAKPPTWPAPCPGWRSDEAGRATSARSGPDWQAGEAVVALFAGRTTAIDSLPAEIEQALNALTLAARPDLARFVETLKAGLEDGLPLLARDGGFVGKGFRPELDELRQLRDDSRRVILGLEAQLQLETAIPLKIRHNGVLGYFVEASANKAEPLFQPPWNAVFIHRQTLANQARFTTVDLADLDARIAQAADRALAMELDCFEKFRTEACNLAAPIRAAADALASLDVAGALAEWAEEVGAVRPVVDDSLVFDAEAARHPVVEAAVRRAGDPFTPNDCKLDGSGEVCARLSLVTGPNMAGKSTFLRQNALLAVMAQAGCFVPARRLRLGVVDRLFSRVGAGDDLARGRSTFMAEMVETAAILTQATARSLVVLDEIGRGTATYDGLAIAWACAEALHDHNRCRALFATHYHELAKLEGPAGACVQFVHEGQGVERGARFPARSRTGRRGPLLRGAGGQAGGGAARRGRPCAGGAGAVGKRARIARAARRPAPLRRRLTAPTRLRKTVEGGKGA